MKLLKQGLIYLIVMSCLISCTKDTVEKPEDELKKSKDLHYGTWTFYQHEIEYYSGNTLISKKVEKFTDYTVEWKTDGTYIQNRSGTLFKGTWDLISPSVFVYDKGDLQNERYYYIIRLDSNFYYRKGPFNKAGGVHKDFLAVEYYRK